MAKLVLDTNCLIQSIPQRSRYHVLWQSFVDGKNKLCVSNEILEEYIEILQRLTDNETAEYGLSGNFWLVSFKISYLCLPLFYETRTTPSCHPSGCAYRQL